MRMRWLLAELVVVATLLWGSDSQPLLAAKTEEQNRMAVENIKAGAPVLDTR